MDYVEIRGEKVPKLGLGTWQLKNKNCVKGVKTALNTGYRHIDTAQAYGNEDRVGKGIEKSEVDRREIFLTTKLWRDNLNQERLFESVEESLEKLRTNYVDLLLIHWPFKDMNQEEVFQELEKVVESGKATNIGISNFNISQMEEAQRISEKKILTNQVEYHPFLDQSKVLNKCRELEMMLTAYSPLARGEVLGNQILNDIGSKHNKSEVQVALRWLVQQDNVAAIPKATSPQHIKENLEIFDFELKDNEMRRIHQLSDQNRKVDPDFAPVWD